MSDLIAKVRDWDDIDAELYELTTPADIAYDVAREQSYGEPMPREQMDRLIVVSSVVSRRLVAFKEAVAACEFRRRR